MASLQVADALATAIYNKIKSTICNLIYPVGSIKLTIVNTNPSKYLGGTWVAWGSGRVPVGIDTSDNDFKTVEKTGGSKFTEKHTHDSTVITKANGTADASTWGELMRARGNNGNVEPKTNQYSSNGYFGTGNAGNLQPYITCYMWKRTA